MKIGYRVLQAISSILLVLSAIAVILGFSTGVIPLGVVGIVLIVTSTAIIIVAGKKSKIPQMKKAGSEFEIHIETIFLEGIAALAPNCYCMLGITGEHLEFKTSSVQTSPTAILLLSQITNIGLFTEAEIIEKSRSVLGRGLVGGMLFGSVGAIVGGLSGTKKKQRKRTHRYLVLNFIPSDSSEPVAATFEMVNLFDNVTSFIDTVNTRMSHQIFAL